MGFPNGVKQGPGYSGRWLVLIVCGILSGCDAGPSAVMPDGKGVSPPEKTEKAPFWAEASRSQTTPSSSSMDETSNPIKDDAPPPSKDLEASTVVAASSDSRYGQWPLWSTSRKYSAQDNAQYQFEHHSSEFGVTAYNDWLAKVHGFIHSPPKGTETLTRRNGDTLFYNAASNTFAVMTKKGAPRIMFKPDDGAAYWQNQKAIESKYQTGGRDNEDGG